MIFIHNTSQILCSIARNSASSLDRATKFCFLFFHFTRFPPRSIVTIPNQIILLKATCILAHFLFHLAEAAKSQFSHDYSDHLAIVKAYEGWKDAEIDFAGHEYCWKNFLSAQSMRVIDALRMEFLSLLKDIGLVDSNMTSCNAWSYDMYLIRAAICYGLYPGICSVVHKDNSFSLKTMEDGKVHLHSNSVNARQTRIPCPWLVFNEKIKVNSVFLRDSTAVPDSVVLLFGGSISKGDTDGHLKMSGGYLEFFMKPAVSDMYQSIRKELDNLIQRKLHFPLMSIHSFHELLFAIRLLICDDKCEGRFVFTFQLLKSSRMALQQTLVSRTDSRPGGDNSKSQLQTLLARAGYGAPFYLTKQLKNNQFQATVEFNGVQIMGQPYNNKKNAEKDAATEALQWLMNRRQTGNEEIDHMPMLLKKSKKDHN
ncbi:DExH-box ATP-dependent RNA helicase DExH5, mitochondrial, partial [Mucuna pruriens]